MTAKEIVKSKYPDAIAERHTQRGYVKDKYYWLIRRRGHYNYISEGTSESNAWVNAKYKILGNQQQSPTTADAGKKE